jgi:ribosome-binding protein aMBF1 (putative translation factor)
MSVFTWALSTAGKLIQFPPDVDPNGIAPISVNTWIGGRVRIKRTSLGIMQEELSELLGIDLNKLAAYEAGVERINSNCLLRIAKLLDVRPDYFFQDYKEDLDED